MEDPIIRKALFVWNTCAFDEKAMRAVFNGVLNKNAGILHSVFLDNRIDEDMVWPF